MIRILLGVTVFVVLALAALLVGRFRTEQRIEALWDSLEGDGGTDRFRPEMVSGLPEPARRYLLHAIHPGTRLASSARLSLSGSIRLSPGAEPMAMRSEEILAPPRGFVWRARVSKGPVFIRGFDAYSAREGGETRWWLWGLVPVAGADGPNVSRSAAGRLIGESVLLPSALLPERGARWEAVDDSTARVRLGVDREVVDLVLHLDPEGGLRRLSFRRWNGDPRNGPVDYLPFVLDELAEERTFDGYTIPTRFRAGWRLGEPDEFPFFFASITDADYR